MPPNISFNAMRKVPAMMNDAQFKWCDPQIQSHFGFPVQLSPRQRQVLLMLCEGLPNKLVGRRLGISDNTVKSHVASVLRGLNAATRLHAVAVAFKLGLVQVGDADRNLKPAARTFSGANRGDRSINRVMTRALEVE